MILASDRSYAHLFVPYLRVMLTMSRFPQRRADSQRLAPFNKPLEYKTGADLKQR